MLKANSARIAPIKILYIEDEFLIAMAQKNTLVQNGYAVTHVTTGEKALAAMASSEHFDLILSDINLGDGLDGPDTAKEILKTQDIPIVFMSSHTEKEVVDKVESITNYGYVIKNSGEFVLVQALKGALRLFEYKQVAKTKTESLEKSEIRFRTMFMKHSAVMLLIEPNTGSIIGANLSAEKFYGHSIEKLSGMSIADFNTLEPAQIAQERQMALEEKRNYFIFSHRLANGEIRTVEVHSSPIVVDDQLILFSVIHDITEHKLAEAEILEKEKRYRILFEQSNDAIFFVDTVTGNYLDANRAAEVLTGRSLSEIKKLKTQDLSPKQAQERIKKVAKSTESLAMGEVDYIRPDGTIRKAILTSIAIGAGQVFGIARDITDLK